MVPLSLDGTFYILYAIRKVWVTVPPKGWCRTEVWWSCHKTQGGKHTWDEGQVRFRLVCLGGKEFCLVSRYITSGVASPYFPTGSGGCRWASPRIRTEGW